MAPELPRTRSNASRLVRLLADLAVADPAESRQPFADRLGQWLSFTDSLSLFSALNADPADASGSQSPAPLAQGTALKEALARVRDALVESIAPDGTSKPGKAHIELPAPAADFAPYHCYYLAQQREMGTRIGSLRASVRAALARHSAKLGHLAALDAVLDQALASRERDLLAKVPALLGRRFEQLYEAHQAALADPRTDEPGQWMQPEGWLALFRNEMQAVLLAELDLRLQPVAGLIAALDQGPGKSAGLQPAA